MTNRRTLRKAIAGILKQTSVSTAPVVTNISTTKQKNAENSSEGPNQTQQNRDE